MADPTPVPTPTPHAHTGHASPPAPNHQPLSHLDRNCLQCKVAAAASGSRQCHRAFGAWNLDATLPGHMTLADAIERTSARSPAATPRNWK